MLLGKEKRVERIKTKAIKDNVPIIMDDTIEVIRDRIASKKCERILEIGTAVGYSAILFTEFLENKKEKNHAQIDTIERNPDMIKKAKKNLKHYKDKINLFEGDAVEVLKTLEETNKKENIKYDMIFIDAAKSKYPIFLDYSLRMLKKDGIIFADNVLYKGYVLSDYNKHKQRTAVTHLREFLRMCQEDTRLDTEILDTGDGLAIIKFK